MRQSQIKLDKDVNLQSEMIEYIMSKCLDNFERSLILIDCAQVYIMGTTVVCIIWALVDTY